MFLRLLWHLARRAASRAACTAGSKSATRMPMIAMTTNSSTSVKPVRRNEVRALPPIAFPPKLGPRNAVRLDARALRPRDGLLSAFAGKTQCKAGRHAILWRLFQLKTDAVSRCSLDPPLEADRLF